jgi:hypothetical protein
MKGVFAFLQQTKAPHFFQLYRKIPRHVRPASGLQERIVGKLFKILP